MVKFIKVLEHKFDTKRKLKSEKDSYKLLQAFVFEKAYKLYTPILRGFPDYIVVKVKKEYEEYLKAGFYEIKYNRGRLNPYQITFLSSLAVAFPVYLVVVKSDYSFVVYRLLPEHC